MILKFNSNTQIASDCLLFPKTLNLFKLSFRGCTAYYPPLKVVNLLGCPESRGLILHHEKNREEESIQCVCQKKLVKHPTTPIYIDLWVWFWFGNDVSDSVIPNFPYQVWDSTDSNPWKSMGCNTRWESVLEVKILRGFATMSLNKINQLWLSVHL